MSRKVAVAKLLDRSGVSSACHRLQSWLCRPHLRAVNYHDVPPDRAADFERQLEFFARHYQPVGLPQLRSFMHGGEWPHPKPGMILSFDDGLRSHVDVVAPLLERHGFPGWFAVPAEFPDLSVGDHVALREERALRYAERGLRDDRPIVSWEDLRALSDPHVICCHSFSHRRLESSLTDAERDLEIRQAKQHLEEGLGRPVPVFVWVGGEEWTYSAEAARVIKAAGFEFGFMTNNAPILPGADPLQLQRTNVEAEDPDALVRLSISGLYDLYYTAKRRRVNRLTKT